jgi:hypothetical protein
MGNGLRIIRDFISRRQLPLLAMKAKSATLRGEARTNGPIEQKGNIMLTWTTPVYQLAATATNRFHDLPEHEFMLMCGTASGHAISFGLLWPVAERHRCPHSPP